MSTVEKFEVDVAGGVIAGSKAGSGPNVVLMHGGPGLSDYLATDPLRDELTSGYTVITFQQRGLAPSTTVGPFSVETHVDDAAAVLHAVAPEGAVVVGHSWGGYLVLHLAATRPELISGVVAVDGVGVLGDGGISDVSRLLDERLTPTARARLAELEERATVNGVNVDDELEALSLTWAARFADPATAPEMGPMRMSLECNADTWASMVSHLENQTVSRLLPEVSIPTVFVLGAQSPIPPRHGVAAAELMPHARADVYEGCGHFPWFERPGVVRAAVDSLRSL